MESVLLMIEGAVELHQERQRLRALAAAHVLWGWKVARVEPHLTHDMIDDMIDVVWCGVARQQEKT